MQKIIIVLFSLVLLTSCEQEKPKNSLQITGNIKGLKKGKIYVQRVEDSTLVVLDTIVLNGKSTFQSTITLDSPEMLYLFLDRGITNSIDNNLLFFAEPGKINIETDLEFFLGKAKITGSKNQELYEQYKSFVSKFNDEQLELVKEQIMSKDKEKFSEENSKKQDASLKRRYLYAANFALTHADHEIAPYIALTDIYDINTKYLDTIQKSMKPNVAKSKYGKKLTEYLLKRKKEEAK